MKKFLAVIPMLALLAAPVDLEAKNKHGKEHKWNGRNSSEWRGSSDQWRYRNSPMRRGTMQGHYPHDANGDGVVSRREWPGNGNAFRQLDRNRDGVLSGADRRLRGNQRYYDNYNRYDGYRYNNYSYPRWVR